MTNSQNIIRLLLLFIILVLLQVVIFNNLDFLGFINPYPYILLVMSMPFGVSTSFLMIIGFGIGLTIDMFSNTPGMHAGSCVLLAYLRPWILKLIALHDDYKTGNLPSSASYGGMWYLKYTILCVSIHHVVLFCFEQIDTILWWPTLLRIILSIAASIVIIYVSQIFIRIGGRE
ncbi:MAG: rod shape-determining protein MreD [Marinilabiliaceae bacterium]|nr:rod shape-determining protein MreD [Marinilabiliaceae bacterium]